MKVLSLFDGMSCGRIALDQMGIKVDTYYASEIDKYAMEVSKANYPDTIYVGDVCNLDPKDYMDVDLILAGSPCQGFSMAGKQLAFDDPRSALFFEFIRLLKEIKPKYFLLENVRMKKEYLQVISEQVSACYPEIPFGIEPTMICSSLVSAQSRKRYYWTNIPNITQPEQKGIVLRDILETTVNQDRLSDMTNQDDKAYCLTTTYPCARPQRSMDKSEKSMIPVEDTVPDSTTLIYDSKDKSHKPVKVGMNVEEVKVRKHDIDIEELKKFLISAKDTSGKGNKQIAKEMDCKYTHVEHWFRKGDFFAIPGDDIWFDLKKCIGIQSEEWDQRIMEFEYRDGVYETKQRVYSENGKSPTLTAGNSEQYIETSDKPIQVGIATDINGHDILKRVYSEDGKSPTVNTCQGGNREPKVVAGAWRARSVDKDGNRVAWKETKPQQMLELRKDNKSNSVTSVQKDSVVVETKPNQINPSKKANGVQPYIQDRVFHVDGKSHCLTREFASRTNVGDVVVKSYKEVRTEEAKILRRENKQKTGKDHTPFRAKRLVPREDGKVGTVTPGLNNDHMISLTKNTESEVYWRKLTPLECERLQTVPDNYTDHVSNSQRFKMLGNGWTIAVIKHIFKNMERE